MSSSITKFRVFGRVRPFIDSELEGKSSGDIRSIVEMTGNRTVLLDPKENYTPKAQFMFDDSLWSIPTDYKLLHTYDDGGKKDFASQRYVYDLAAGECCDNAFNGVNSTIMSYGQTGSGKTYSMMGKYDPQKVCGGDGEEGIIPRVCNDVFATVEKRRAEEAKRPESERREITVEVTFVEIYMEKVRDLLDKANAHRKERREARIRVDPASGPFVEDVVKYRVSNWSHCCKLLEQGSTQRTTSANVVHEESSRSHAIFTLTVLQTLKVPPKDKYSAGTTETISGRINLVDLAGSERGGMTDYVKESSKINTSLLALRRVIDTLVERQRITMEQMSAEIQGTSPSKAALQQMPAVPYRDSVLTWLLSDSMGGNAMTTMIAALSPHEKNYNDTIATLQWSSKARNLVGVVKVNDSQSQVQNSMLGKRTDLKSSVSNQRHTVDGLRNELELKKNMTEDYQKKAVALKKSYMNLLQQRTDLHTLGAVLIVQLFARKMLHRVHMKRYAERLKKTKASAKEQEAALKSITKESAAAVAAFKATEAAAAARKKELKDMEAKIVKFESNEEEFSIKYEAAMELLKEGESKVDDYRQQLAEKEKAVMEENEAASVRVIKARERLATDTKKLAEVEAFVHSVTVDEQDQWKQQAEELEKKNAAWEEANLKELREHNAKLLAEKKDLLEKIKAKEDKKKKK